MTLEFVTNPFYSPENPESLPTYGTPGSSILSVFYNNLKSIFSYKSISEPDLLDHGLKKWIQRDINNVYFKELDLSVNAGASPLGFAKSSKDVTCIITPGFGLPYFVNAFQTNQDDSKFVFNVGSLDYDEANAVLTNDYTIPLATAEQLGFPVISPINFNEVQATSLLSIIVAKFSTTRGTLHLYDGLNLSKIVLQIDEKPIHTDNLIEEIGNKLPVIPTFENILDAFNETANQKLHNFEYYGTPDAETVFVTYGVIESQLFKDLIEGSRSKVGLICVRIPLPFDIDRFVTHIPQSTQRLALITQYNNTSSPSFLKSQVSHALFVRNRKSIVISDYLYEPSLAWSPTTVSQIILLFVENFDYPTVDHHGKNFIYWGSDKGANIDLASRLVYGLSLGDSTTVSLRTKFNNIINAGVFQAQFSANQVTKSVSISNIDASDFTIVEDHSLLKNIDIIATTKDETPLIIITQKSFEGRDLTKADYFIKELGIPEQAFFKAIQKKLKLIVIDTEALSKRQDSSGDEVSFITQFLFWQQVYQYEPTKTIRYIWETSCHDKELPASYVEKTILNCLGSYVKEIPLATFNDFKATEEINDGEFLPKYISDSAFAANDAKLPDEDKIVIDTKVDVARLLTFKEAYNTSSKLRPDLPVRNFIVKVKENRRITPTDYDRNIFHIEFDISGTGLTYGIGEALGIHARNNENMVNEFIESYGLDKYEIVSVPNKDQTGVYESRTVFQAFVENLDIFGKPPKRFYESLIEYASDEKEKKKLQDLIEPAGASELKRYQDVEFYTYADILELFPSAKPPLSELIEIIAPLKRREYSIASSQKVHPNEVHLLIVVVDWIDQRGRKRFGHASKYISDLSIGTELVVSVKPSVMKLPPNPEQPVIMSGLGTGLAPFKAIIEEKVWQKQQGFEIGEVYLYLGSRHKREEYLYGELWEAYKDAGIITHIGAAFSRDQLEKIYIQDRIRENINELKTAMINKQGSFYLCGPTWPVPDITNVLQDIISADAQEKGIKVDLNAAIEELKETSRYILEVY